MKRWVAIILLKGSDYENITLNKTQLMIEYKVTVTEVEFRNRYGEMNRVKIWYNIGGRSINISRELYNRIRKHLGGEWLRGNEITLRTRCDCCDYCERVEWGCFKTIVVNGKEFTTDTPCYYGNPKVVLKYPLEKRIWM